MTNRRELFKGAFAGALAIHLGPQWKPFLDIKWNDNGLRSYNKENLFTTESIVQIYKILPDDTEVFRHGTHSCWITGHGSKGRIFEYDLTEEIVI